MTSLARNQEKETNKSPIIGKKKKSYEKKIAMKNKPQIVRNNHCLEIIII